MTFFSGTDNSTLKEQGAQMPHFLSLIVNNRMNMVAKITRTVIYKALSYNTYKGKNVKMKEDTSVKGVQIFDVKIELPTLDNIIEEIQERIKELQTKDFSNTSIVRNYKYPYYKEKEEDYEYPEYLSMYSYKKTTSPVSSEPSLWSESEENQDIYEEEGTQIPEDVFRDLMAKIFTCDLSATADNINLDIITLEHSYSALFEKDLSEVSAFLTGYLYYLINRVKKDPTSDKFIRPGDVCDQLLAFLKDFDMENDYVKTIINVLIELP